ncbi:oxygen-independent coproporphyrinogen III oxidase [Falsihalocynthiibacter sp. SS001]|uniref:oxygen-independent coproporphyrinogen III oxidase n=1 Tax=Falsihalocynthiibacter sp. SS001 TaxID=3349698 RepID=UPI0036D3DAA8
MENIEKLKAYGLFDARVPRYTSYPTAAMFTSQCGSDMQLRALESLDPDIPVSVYIHIPFCERLCWFCACHTQGTQTLAPVESYIETLEAELKLVQKTIPDGLRMGRLHWGGGTPTILPPHLIHRLAQAIFNVFLPDEDFEFSVEIDPTMVDRDKIDALAANGMKRASIGIQDFDPEVQAAIGRAQPFDITKACVDHLRAAGIKSLNADLVYGLPHQTLERLTDTVDKVLNFAPDRIALFGYAHVPWASKRQKLIDEQALPDDLARYHLSTRAAAQISEAGLAPIGIDHFARLGDELETAAQNRRLRRNFQGYTADTCQTLIGLGASSISRFPNGYIQNAPATAAYIQRINAGEFAGAKGYALTQEDRLRARAIELLMCEFEVALSQLEGEFGEHAKTLAPDLRKIAGSFQDFVDFDGQHLSIHTDGRALTRIIAAGLDQHVPDRVTYSRAS